MTLKNILTVKIFQSMEGCSTSDWQSLSKEYNLIIRSVQCTYMYQLIDTLKNNKQLKCKCTIFWVVSERCLVMYTCNDICILTFCLIAKLSTNYSSILGIPLVITYRNILTANAYFHSALIGCGSICQTNVSTWTGIIIG